MTHIHHARWDMDEYRPGLREMCRPSKSGLVSQVTPSPYGQKPQLCFQSRCVKLSSTADRHAYYLGEEKPPVALLAYVSFAGDLITVHVFIFSSMVVNNAVKAVGTVITETSTSQLRGAGPVFTKTVSLSLQRLNSEAQACSYHGEGQGNG